jgi:hypothetical protein
MGLRALGASGACSALAPVTAGREACPTLFPRPKPLTLASCRCWIYRDPYRIDGMDVFSNILYVKEQEVQLSHLAHSVSLTDKYRCAPPGTAALPGLRCAHSAPLLPHLCPLPHAPFPGRRRFQPPGP